LFSTSRKSCSTCNKQAVVLPWQFTIKVCITLVSLEHQSENAYFRLILLVVHLQNHSVQIIKCFSCQHSRFALSHLSIDAISDNNVIKKLYWKVHKYKHSFFHITLRVCEITFPVILDDFTPLLVCRQCKYCFDCDWPWCNEYRFQFCIYWMGNLLFPLDPSYFMHNKVMLFSTWPRLHTLWLILTI
jgi:hypothetical protein